MKLIILPLYRLFYVIIAMMMVPFVYLSHILVAFWNFDFKRQVKSVTDDYFKHFVDEDTLYHYVALEYEDYYYRNPIDYLLDKRTKTRV